MRNREVEIEVPQEILVNWQEMANILARIINVPAALIMRYIDPFIEVFISNDNEDNPYYPGDKEVMQDSGLYCETVIKSNQKLLIPNALIDENWKNNPDIKMNMISYLGFPIHLPDNRTFGTICILDNKSNAYSETTEKLMLQFRNLLESQLELIYMNQSLGEKNKRLSDYLEELMALRGIVPICANCKSIKDENNNWHPIEHYLMRNPEVELSHGICPKCRKKLYPDYT